MPFIDSSTWEVTTVFSELGNSANLSMSIHSASATQTSPNFIKSITTIAAASLLFWRMRWAG